MTVVNPHLATPARMLPPNEHGYVLLAAEVQWPGLLRGPGSVKRQILTDAKAWSLDFAMRNDVVEATVFRAVLVANDDGRKLVEARGVHRARFDVVVLVTTTSVQAAKDLRDDPEFRALADAIRGSSSHTMQVVARNEVRLGDVDHRPDDVYLFNYFYADNDDDLVPVFRYTAGWFQAKTALPNSTLLLPLPGEATDYGVINHASWPNFRTFLPSLIFRPTFRRFVLANFAANNVAAQPILYRRL